MKRDYIINYGEQTITITKAFATRAADISTREYRELTKLHRDFPDYTIQNRTAVIHKDKATYKGLTLDGMETYIKAQDSSSEGLKAFEASKRPRKLVIKRIKPTSESVAESHRRNLKKFQKLKGDGKNANL